MSETVVPRAHSPVDAPSVAPPVTRAAILGWFASGAALMFVVSWLGTGVLRLQHDLYYLIYFTVVAAFLVAFVVRTGLPWTGIARTRLWWSLGLGAIVGVAGVTQSVLAMPGTPRPDGVYFVFELLWRGVAYGAVDALILYAFPALVAWALLRGRVARVGQRIGFAALTLVLVAAITATYHLGYAQFRGSDVREPETGAMIMSIPTVLTANPAGAVVAHSAVHVAAVVHAYDGHSLLPPDLTTYEPRWPGVPSVVIALGWLAVTASAYWYLRRHGAHGGHGPARQMSPWTQAGDQGTGQTGPGSHG